MSDPLAQSAETTATPSESPGVISDASVVPVSVVQHVLGIYMPDGPQRTQLNALTEFISNKAGGGSPEEVRAALYGVEKGMGSPKLGETRLGRLYNYIKLSQRIQDLESARLEYLA